MSNYYKENSQEFIDGTINCDMTIQYEFFERYLYDKPNTILDLGFGSGRDSLYFSKKYDVYSLDPVEEFCDNAKKLGLKNVYCTTVQDMKFNNMFDGIWACASLLHIPYNELNQAFKKCYDALKSDGVMYCSFKYGTYQGERNGRYFTDLNEELLFDVLMNTGLTILETSITEDVRAERSGKWLNAILRKPEGNRYAE